MARHLRLTIDVKDGDDPWGVAHRISVSERIVDAEFLPMAKDRPVLTTPAIQCGKAVARFPRPGELAKGEVVYSTSWPNEPMIIVDVSTERLLVRYVMDGQVCHEILDARETWIQDEVSDETS